jgi:hypothetical protein
VGVFNAGGSLTWGDQVLDEEYAPPALGKELYQFTRAGDLLAISPDQLCTNGGLVVTNLLVASVGDPDFAVSPWLRYRLLNGNPGTYAFIEQYFGHACKADTNGNATSTETGILSPYGYFFPTEPGDVALVTTPNIEDGGTGSAVVHVISMSTDVDRDGVIDPTFYGPDFVSTNHPFRFWVNDSSDSGDDGGNGIPGSGKPNALAGVVTGSRDLVNFFPVSLNIQSLLQSQPDHAFTCWLSQADGALNYVDTAWYDDATNLTTSNALVYLTDTTFAGRLARTTPPTQWL